MHILGLAALRQVAVLVAHRHIVLLFPPYTACCTALPLFLLALFSQCSASLMIVKGKAVGLLVANTKGNM